MSVLLATLALAVSAAPPYLPSVQAWTFNRLSAFEAVDAIARAGGKGVEFYPGQRLGEVEGQMGPGMSSEAMAKLKERLAQRGVQANAFGVVDIPRDEAAARRLFAWAKDLGIKVINTEAEGSIDTIEKMVKEFDIKVGFHNHPRQPNNPNYKMWDPNHVLALVKNRDRRIGSCADTGHWVRSGLKPIEAIRILRGRIVSSHFKDNDRVAPGARDVPYGTGISDTQAMLNELIRQGFNGPLSVEYEHYSDNLHSEVSQCLGYLLGFGQGRR